MFDRVLGRATRTAVSVAVVLAALILSGVFTFVGMQLFAGVENVGLLTAVVVTLAELGFVGAALVFLVLTSDRWESVGLRSPDGSDLRYAVGGTLATYAVAVTGMLTASAVGSPGQRIRTEELTGQGFEGMLLALVVVSVVVIGPSEELLFRGVVQRYLYGAFSRAGAIAVASVIFALVHVPTVLLAGSGLAAVAGGVVIFVVSVVLGYLYARTENLVVPAVVHGVYDATLFGAVYLALRFGML